MAYNISDLIRKSVDISSNMIEIYYNMNKEQNEVNPLKVLSSVFINKEKHKIEYYKKLEYDCKNKELKEIDFFIYDKVSSLMNQFNNKLKSMSIHSSRELIKCTLNTNENIRALFVDIRGRLVQKKGDGDSYEYQVLTKMIYMQEEYISDLKKLYRD